MNDLLRAGIAGGVADEYSAKDIEVLEGLEPVRRRPGMYIGGTDENALHHLAAEILDNAMDEAVAGHASRIEVEPRPCGAGDRPFAFLARDEAVDMTDLQLDRRLAVPAIVDAFEEVIEKENPVFDIAAVIILYFVFCEFFFLI